MERTVALIKLLAMANAAFPQGLTKCAGAQTYDPLRQT